MIQGSSRIRPRTLLLIAVVMYHGAAWAQTSEDILTYRGPDREQKLVEGAKKEGQVVIYAAMIQNQAMRPMADGFGRKYPFIKLTTWRADSEDIVLKAAAEVRASNVVADLIEGTGAGEQAVAADIVQPSVWLGARRRPAPISTGSGSRRSSISAPAAPAPWWTASSPANMRSRSIFSPTIR